MLLVSLMRVSSSLSLLISSELAQRVNELEQRAELAGFSFPLNQHIENEITRLVKAAEGQLTAIESSTS